MERIDDMGHITLEVLAGLVDGSPSSTEEQHLADCEKCRDELSALKAQAQALAGMPDLHAPQDSWKTLENRLAEEGLIASSEYRLNRFRPVLTTWVGLGRSWAARAAALVVFLAGAAAGTQFAPGEEGADDSFAGGSLIDTSEPAAFARSITTPEEAAQALRDTEIRYVTLRARLEELMVEQSGRAPDFDPYRRFAALEHLAAASQAAVRQAPGDPYFNGLLVSVMGEREATARMVSATDGEF